MTESEVLANLHMIKLYILHKLREYYARKPDILAELPKLAKLEPECVKLAFKEMREDMEDDGLFDQMAPFFYPLTVTEEELSINKEELDRFSRAQEREKANLKDEGDELSAKLSEQKDKCQKVEAQIEDLERRKRTNEDIEKLLEKTHAHKLIPNFTETCRQNRLTSQQELNKLKKKHAIEGALLNKIEAEYTRKQELLLIIENDLKRPAKEKNVIDNRLCKPHRGFIMYGPPGNVYSVLKNNITIEHSILGTGKSQIMKELAKKVGIAMLGPPLASGELDRPLVGQSEKVILDLCSRGHCLSHLMCCVCIDEIDALAPRRDEDASEGRVARISVLLSVVEGIKDIPNLMFFSATNRLHMMDEAFLRRMTGKFFVGRPTFNARKRILQKIPQTILTSAIRDNLAQATINFSGAAVRYVLNLAIKCKMLSSKLF